MRSPRLHSTDRIPPCVSPLSTNQPIAFSRADEKLSCVSGNVRAVIYLPKIWLLSAQVERALLPSGHR